MATQTKTTAVQKTATPAAPATPTNKPVVKRQTLNELITGDRFATALRRVLPKYLTPELFVGIACGQLKRVPNLAKCEQTSFFECLTKCAELGLIPNGRLAYMIPFKDGRASREQGRDVFNCNLVIGYKGFVELAKRSGAVKTIYAEMLCENDEFENDCGEVHHRIDYQHDRGKPYAVLCVIKTPDGEQQSCVMPLNEVEKVRNGAQSYQQYVKKCAEYQQKGWNPPPAPPWVEYFDEMAKKTCFRRLAKWLVTTPQFEMAEELDNRDFIDTTAQVVDVHPQVKKANVRQVYGTARALLPSPVEEQEHEPDAGAFVPQGERVPVPAGEGEEGEVFA